MGELSVSNWRCSSAARCSTGLLISLACCLTASAGCGTSVYAEKFNKRLDELKITSPFAELRQPTDDLPINFRIPLLFTEAYDRNSAHPLDAQAGQPKRIHPDRVAPPFMQDFPGLRVMYQVELDEPPPPQNKVQSLPVYCYLGEGATASVKGKFPYDAWLAQIKNRLHDPDINGWETVEVNTPELNAAGQVKKLTWKRLVAKGKQEFDMVNFSTREFKTLDGYFELWVYETPEWTAVLGWRAPQSIVERIHLPDLAKLTAGTAVINPAIKPSEKEKAAIPVGSPTVAVNSAAAAEAGTTTIVDGKPTWTSGKYRFSIALPTSDWRYVATGDLGTDVEVAMGFQGSDKLITVAALDTLEKEVNQDVEARVEKIFLDDGRSKIGAREMTIDGRKAYRVVIAGTSNGAKFSDVEMIVIWHGRLYHIASTSWISDADTDPDINAGINSFRFLDPQ